MKAMVLSAGLGLRMRPLTLTVPKTAVPVLGRPLLIQILNRLAGYGVTDTAVNVHHRPEVVETLLGEGVGAGLPRVRFSREATILGTAGGLRHAAPLLIGEGPILVHNCDFLSNIDLAAVLEVHRDSGKLATLVLAPARAGYSTVVVNASGDVISLAGEPRVDPEHSHASFLFTGCHVIDEDVLGLVPSDGPSDIVRDVYRDLAARGRLGSFVHHGFWWEFGTPESYLEGSLRLLQQPPQRRADIAVHDAVKELGGGLAAVGCGVQLGDGVRVDGHAALGFASSVGPGTRLSRTVVMPEAWVGPECRLEHTVVGPGVELPRGHVARHALITVDPGGEIDLPADVRREGGLLVRPLAGATNHDG